MMIATTVGEKETTKQFRRKDKKLKDLHIDEPKVIPRWHELLAVDMTFDEAEGTNISFFHGDSKGSKEFSCLLLHIH